ncbi:MAG: tRNA uridine-5-carboxymethylaminomethyl(34) synthesis enzyme MnmG, partial [Gammaproteobacteria bacterium]|nr:tRNA uridine-5-carboxymethylaminomethyl(34) synthesis enzyme MnmG [Gammaproteobacteria bacterium]
ADVEGLTLSKEVTLLDLLRRPGVTYEHLGRLTGEAPPLLDAGVMEQIEIQAKYSGYIGRQQEEIDRQRRNEETLLPEDMNYAEVRGLSTEVQQKLCDHRPSTLGQAARISGVTPAAISLLMVHLKTRKAS